MSRSSTRSGARSAARLAAVQALYQHDMEAIPAERLLAEFHAHRLGATIEDTTYRAAEPVFFDDIVVGALARKAEIDTLIAAHLHDDWTPERLDKPLYAILRAGTYELLARTDITPAAIINDYLDVAHAFYAKREKAFVNGILDAIAADVRPDANRTGQHLAS